LKYQFPALGWAGLIFFLSSLEKIPTIKFFLSPDKLGHSFVFLILTFLTWRAFKYQNSAQWLKDRAILFAFCVAVVYGYSDEFHQRFVPGRLFDLYDILADAFGASLFIAGHWLFKKYSKTPQPADSK
jgi:VanZ family protein